MMRFFLFLLISLICVSAKAQKHWVAEAKKLKPEKEFSNIHVKPLYSDEKVSSFVIWIKEQVPLHKHVKHSEHVYVLKGKGSMKLGDKVIQVKKGDFIMIPEGTPHSVKVKGGTLQVLSIQAPEFKGKDRVPLE